MTNRRDVSRRSFLKVSAVAPVVAVPATIAITTRDERPSRQQPLPLHTLAGELDGVHTITRVWLARDVKHCGLCPAPWKCVAVQQDHLAICNVQVTGRLDDESADLHSMATYERAD